MHTGGLGCHLALIALGHTSLALADQAISVGHAAIVLSQWLHLMACLALLHNIKGACMHMRLTFIHSSIHSFIHSFIQSYSEQAGSVSCPRARFTLAKRAEQQNCNHAAGVCNLVLHLAPDVTITSLEALTLRYEHFLCIAQEKGNMPEDIDRHKVYLVGGKGFLRQCDINWGFGNRPALLLGRQAVALVLRTLGVLAGLAVAVQAVLVHPIAREVLRWLDLATCPAVLQDIEWQSRQIMVL